MTFSKKGIIKMNIYVSLNKMLEYIEENLDNKIEYSKLAQFLGTN